MSWPRSAPTGIGIQKPKSIRVKSSEPSTASRLLGQASPWPVTWGRATSSSTYAGTQSAAARILRRSSSPNVAATSGCCQIPSSRTIGSTWLASRPNA